tara:strand:- start:335 stop:1111 length:777 start_codon:yes stop_codon:yes gene_type:complete
MKTIKRFKSHFTPIVELQFPKIAYPEKYTQANGYEAALSTDKDAFWSVVFTLDEEQRKAMWEVGLAHYNDMIQKDDMPPLKEGQLLFRSEKPWKDIEGNPIHGMYQYTAGKPCFNNAGNATRRPEVLNGNREIVSDVSFWGGSTGRVKLSMLCTVNPGKDKIGGIKLYLDKIQLINPIYGGGFEKEPDAPSNSLETATTTEEPTPMAQPQPLPTMTEKIYGEKPLSQPTPPTPPSFDLEIEGQEQAATSNDMDDEIPF